MIIAFLLATQTGLVPVPAGAGPWNYDVVCELHSFTGKTVRASGYVRQVGTSGKYRDIKFAMKVERPGLPSLPEQRFLTDFPPLVAAMEVGSRRYTWGLYIPPSMIEQNGHVALFEYDRAANSSKFVATGLCDLTRSETVQ